MQQRKDYTTEEAARVLEREPVTLRGLAKRYRVGYKRAGVWFFTDEDLAFLLRQPRLCGRPRSVRRDQNCPEP